MAADSILIGCDVVIKEMAHRIGDHLKIHVIDPSLHVNPDRLRKTIQETIEAVEQSFGTILLGFGYCSRAAEGLRSRNSKIVIPLVHDCVGLFLGSRSAHTDMIKTEPGSFFLSKGWVEAGTTPFEEYRYMVKRYGEKKADSLMNAMLRHYQLLKFIRTENTRACTHHRRYAREKALKFGLNYQEILGNTALFDDLINKNDNDELRTIRPGECIRYDMFFNKT